MIYKNIKTKFLFISRIITILPKERKNQIALIVVLTVFSAGSDLLSVTLFGPLLAGMSFSQGAGNEAPETSLMYSRWRMSGQESGWYVFLAFTLAALLSGCMKVALLSSQIKTCHAVGSDISRIIYKNIICRDYETHVNSNSSQTISMMANKANSIVDYILMPVMLLISSTVSIIAVLAAMVFVAPKVTVSVVVIVIILYCAMLITISGRIKNASQASNKFSDLGIKIIQESLGSIRDVIIAKRQDFYISAYCEVDGKRRSASASVQLLSQIPKPILESVGMIVLCSFAFYISQSDQGANHAVPIIGAIALGAQRLLPAIQQIYSNIVLVKGSQSMLSEAVATLNDKRVDLEGESNGPAVKFNKEIKISNLSFTYRGSACPALSDINLVIPMGARVGIIGETGSGKSTFVDLLLGLLLPTSGLIQVDDICLSKDNIRNWQQNICHVPQNVYLFDGSVKENIALTKELSEESEEKLVQVCERVGISDLLNRFSNGAESKVGERGVQLSGGQRQRIGIARAIYTAKPIMVMDEGTSALDEKSEIMVMNVLYSLPNTMTMFIVTHKPSALFGCTHIIKIENRTAVIFKNSQSKNIY
jgi:ABC-type multidrug transport system fused ATPase/permease subunit